MAKGYWIANVDVRDADGYKAYVGLLPDIFRKFGGKYTTRGGKMEVVEGTSRPRVVIIEFPSFEAAMTCYRSPEYAKAIALRRTAADADLIVIEGYDGPQP
ncbi:MAG TPA: DUF1330 domain-containing protein [Pseudolabrys sp.]|nr:DUF1330 domain-containing protein [Pseudolabrys sp.]